jgi:hypothetical protein
MLPRSDSTQPRRDADMAAGARYEIAVPLTDVALLCGLLLPSCLPEVRGVAAALRRLNVGGAVLASVCRAKPFAGLRASRAANLTPSTSQASTAPRLPINMSLLGKKFGGAIGTSLLVPAGDEAPVMRMRVLTSTRSQAHAPLLRLRYVAQNLEWEASRPNALENGLLNAIGRRRRARLIDALADQCTRPCYSLWRQLLCQHPGC